jgi:hypothetical protein
MMRYGFWDSDYCYVADYIVCSVYLLQLFRFQFVGEKRFQVSFQLYHSPEQQYEMEMLRGIFRFVFPSSLIFAAIPSALNPFSDGFLLSFFNIHYASSPTQKIQPSQQHINIKRSRANEAVSVNRFAGFVFSCCLWICLCFFVMWKKQLRGHHTFRRIRWRLR